MLSLAYFVETLDHAFLGDLGGFAEHGGEDSLERTPEVEGINNIAESDAHDEQDQVNGTLDDRHELVPPKRNHNHEEPGRYLGRRRHNRPFRLEVECIRLTLEPVRDINLLRFRQHRQTLLEIKVFVRLNGKLGVILKIDFGEERNQCESLLRYIIALVCHRIPSKSCYSSMSLASSRAFRK